MVDFADDDLDERIETDQPLYAVPIAADEPITERQSSHEAREGHARRPNAVSEHQPRFVEPEDFEYER